MVQRLFCWHFRLLDVVFLWLWCGIWCGKDGQEIVAISSRMARAAATGLSARVMGRPTTSREAPWAMAAAGVATRFWSPMAEPAGRIPGTTRWASGPSSARRVATSSAEQTSAGDAGGFGQPGEAEDLLGGGVGDANSG